MSLCHIKLLFFLSVYISSVIVEKCSSTMWRLVVTHFHVFSLTLGGALSSQNLLINNAKGTMASFTVLCELLSEHWRECDLYVCRFLPRVHRMSRYDPSETKLCVPLIYLSSWAIHWIKQILLQHKKWLFSKAILATCYVHVTTS